MKKIIAIAIVTAAFFSILACKKKEEQPVPQAPAQGPIITPHSEAPAQGMPPHGAPQQKRIERKIVVPDEVRESWSAVKLVIKDKKANKQKDFTIAIGEELSVPDSSLIIKVVHFLPDFRMTDQTITSASNNADNPSAGVIIFDNGRQIFPLSGELAWLFLKIPDVHPFQHERFEVALAGGVKK